MLGDAPSGAKTEGPVVASAARRCVQQKVEKILNPLFEPRMKAQLLAETAELAAAALMGRTQLRHSIANTSIEVVSVNADDDSRYSSCRILWVQGRQQRRLLLVGIENLRWKSQSSLVSAPYCIHHSEQQSEHATLSSRLSRYQVYRAQAATATLTFL